MLPGAFQMNVTGSMESVTDSIRRTGEIQLKARSGNLDFLLAMLPASQRDQFAIPAGTSAVRLTYKAPQPDAIINEVIFSSRK